MVDKNLTEGKAKSILGVSGSNVHNGQIRADEFLPELRGKKAIRTYQQMRDNDATIGAVLYAVEQWSTPQIHELHPLFQLHRYELPSAAEYSCA